jgi:protocatechuate 3,4-dioxygenase alpha subunit
VKTPSQTVGPYYAIGLCRYDDHRLVPDGIVLTGQLFDGLGEPIADGMVEAWDATARRWGRSGTDDEGRFQLVVPKPTPADGAPHLDVFVFARGLLRHQLTRVYFPDEHDANAHDPVLAGLGADDQATLIASAEGGGLRFDIRMQGARATVFFEH